MHRDLLVIDGGKQALYTHAARTSADNEQEHIASDGSNLNEMHLLSWMSTFLRTWLMTSRNETDLI